MIESLSKPLAKNIVQNAILSAGQSNLQILQQLFTDTGANGGAWDFTDSANLYQDSGATTPVTTGGDLVGYAADESGNPRNLTQATAANKPQWVANSGGLFGVQGIDAGDLLAATISGSDDCTLVMYVTNPSVTGGWAGWQYLGSNYSMGLSHETGNWYLYQDRLGIKSTLLKTAPTAGEEATIWFKYDANPVRREAQYNDETSVVATDGLVNLEYGNSIRLPQNFYGIVHRAVWMEYHADSDQIATLKTLVQEGW